MPLTIGDSESSTCVMELQSVNTRHETASTTKGISKQIHRALGRSGSVSEEVNVQDHDQTLPSPTTAGEMPTEKWYTPRINMYRVFATFWSFVVMGMNDASYGVSIAIEPQCFKANASD